MGQIEGSALVTKSIANEGITTLFGLAGGPIVEVMGYGPGFGVRPHRGQARAGGDVRGDGLRVREE